MEIFFGIFKKTALSPTLRQYLGPRVHEYRMLRKIFVFREEARENYKMRCLIDCTAHKILLG